MRRKIETRGSVVLGGAAALAAAGLLRVDGVLLMLGLAGAGWVGLAALFAIWNLRGLSLRVEGPRVVRAGEAFRLRVTVENGKRWLDSIGLRLHVSGPGEVAASSDVPWVMAGDTAEGELRVSAQGRGDGVSVDYRIGSNFPWGLLDLEIIGKVNYSLTVLPRPMVPVELLQGGSDQEKDGSFDPQRRESAGMPRGLREFRAGDRPRDVAWSASVRAMARGTGELVVREWDPPGLRPRKVTMLFHSYGSDGELIRPDRFERAISLAWGALGHLQASGVEIQWMADFEAWVPATIRNRKELGQLGDRLASCQREASTESHELEARLNECSGEVWIISDMAPCSWLAVVDAYSGAKVIDVTRFEKGRRLALEGRVHA